MTLASSSTRIGETACAEYVVHRTYDGEIDWFILREGQYERLTIDAAGIQRSEAFPGLWLDAAAMIEGRLADVLTVLQRGLASDEHASFLKALAAAKLPS